MFRQEFKRLIKSKATLIIVILILISLASFFSSHSEKQTFIEQFETDYSEDINRDALANMIENYTGIKFLFDFWFNSEFSQIFMILMYIWVGIFISPSLIIHKEHGLGNLMVSRKNYTSFARTTMLAQGAYVFLITTITTIIQFFIAQFWGGWGTTGKIGRQSLNFNEVILIVIIQIFIVSTYLFFAATISMLCEVFIENKYFIQILPLLIFVFAPMIIITILGNIYPFVASVLIYFQPYEITTIVCKIIQDSFDSSLIVGYIIPFVLLTATFLCLFVVNSKKNSRDYI